MRETAPVNCSLSDRQPIRHRGDLRQFEILRGEAAGLRLVLDRDGVARLHVEGGDVHLAAIHLHVAVRDELAGAAAGIREAEAIDDVVETGLEQLQEDFAGDTAAGRGDAESNGGTGARARRIGSEASAFPPRATAYSDCLRREPFGPCMPGP